MKKSILKFFSMALSVSAIAGSANAAITSADTYNQRNTQEAINSVSLVSPAFAAQSALISALPENVQRSALDDISGEQYANIIQVNQVASQQFMRRMYDSVRYETLGLTCGQNCDQFSVWSAVGGGQARQRSSHGAKGYKLNDWNISFGAYKPLNFNFLDSWLTVGVAGSYERDNIKYGQGGRGHGDNWQGAIYTMWTSRDFYSFSANIIGTNQVFLKRHIDVGAERFTARSRARTTQWTSYTEFGYNTCFDSVFVQPFAGLEYAWYDRHALSEHGGAPFNLHVRGKEFSATIARLGLHLSTNLPSWGVVVSGDLAYRARLNFLTERFQASFKHFGDTARFRIHGPHMRPNGFEGALTVAKCFAETYQTYIEIAGETWKHFATWNISAGVSANF